MDLLFIISLVLYGFYLFAFFHRVGVVAVIAVDPALSEYLQGDTTSAVEELTIMRDDDVASFPGVLEVVLEPFDRYEIDEVGGLIEEEEIRARE